MSNFKYYFFLITFTSEFIYAGGSLQLCNKHIDTYGSSIGSESYKKDLTHYSSVTKIICNTNDDARFSLNSEGDGLGQYGYDASKAQIKGMASGKITIRSTETTFTGYSKFQNNISLDNNKIFNIKDGTLSENSKEAVNGSQLFKIDSVKADKVSLNNTDKNVSENADSINKLDENLKKTNQQIEINTTSINKHNMELKEYNSAIKDIDFKTRDLTNTADILSKIAIKTQQDMNENTQSISRLNQDKADKAQLAETDKRVDANAHNLVMHQTRIEANRDAINGLNQDKADKAQLAETDKRVDANAHNLAMHQTRIEANRDAINGLNQDKADKAQLVETDKRVDANAHNLAMHQTRIEANRDAINGLNQDKADKAQLAETDKQVDANAHNLAMHQTHIEANRDAINGLNQDKADKAQLVETDKRVDANAHNLAMHQTRIEANRDAINGLNQDKADKAQLAETDKRVGANTHNIATYQNSIDNNTQAIDWLDKNKVDKAQLIETTNLVRENTAEINSNREAIDDIKSSNILQENLINHRTDNLINLEKISRDEGDKRVLTSSKSYTDSRFSSAISYADDKFGQLDNKINQKEKKLNAGIAGVTAISSIPYVSENTFSYGMGVGNYQNGNAIAAGVQLKTIYNSNIRVNISWDSSSNTALGVGISGGW
ncbi:TPA: YadA-like family protein [Proteus mirabilis]|uniref:YadA-like family protein n=1 Tax=Proteus mirabilis TaxID=584 RepID=UPI002554E916|nr:YadA-like family protein [Proteus mirabilis]MDK7937922.1 YadA-like family protein [Proteus mirabilis]MDU1385277.1 YadA-like family protein [Proteus mirabilis]